MRTTIPAMTWVNPAPPPKAETWALVVPPLLIVVMLAWASAKAARPDLPDHRSALAADLAGQEPEPQEPALNPLDLWAL